MDETVSGAFFAFNRHCEEHSDEATQEILHPKAVWVATLRKGSARNDEK